MSGVESTGFVIKTLAEIREEIEAEFRTAYGEGVNLLATSNFGQLIGIMAEREALLWQLAQAIYNAAYPQASGASLDNVAAITGVTRLEAEPSTVELFVTGTPTTALTTGRVASVTDAASKRFTTLADATIAAATAWVNTTAYVAGDVRTNASRIYRCITSGTSAGSGGPTTTADDITDGTAHWRYMGEGTGYAVVDAECEDDGPTVANAYTIEAIETPVSGWQNVTNILDAVVGRDIETDTELRLRRQQLLRASGGSTLDAIRADVLEVEDVIECRVFENTTDAVDGDGLPAHSIEVVVRGGDDQDIVDAIWSSKPAGIATFGTSNGTATDSQGVTHTVYFTRPTVKTIHIDMTVSVNEDEYPSDGDDQIRAALVAHGDALGVGADVIWSALFEPIFSVSGVEDLTDLDIGFTDPPSASVNLAIGSREVADFDSANIDIITS